jgi:plastocyanin
MSWALVRRAFLALALMAALGSCSGAGDDAVEIRMLDNSFAPFVVEVDPGDTLTFVNDGRAPHNAIAVDGSFSTIDIAGANTFSGESVNATIDAEGVYDFYCSLHATQQDDGTWEGMVGTLIVGGAADSAEVAAAGSEAPTNWTEVTRAVPGDYPNIQAAVDAADPGDLVLIDPGVYREAVTVTTPGLTIRGKDRNATILDGEFTRDNGIAVTADGVAIENLTARNYTVNGFFWNGVTGYRGSYLTAIDDWVYGIYAFDSVDGVLEHSYASGSFDAGFYVGQCDPCNAVVTDVLAEYNGLGYSGTNSSGNMYIVNSEWRRNVGGIAPNTLDSELLPPVNNVTIAGNYVHHNGAGDVAPSGTFQWLAHGVGVALAGARDSVVRDNLLVNNSTSGVAVVSMIDANVWPSGDNEIRGNVIRGSGRADLALGGPNEQGTCFADNDASTSVPYLLGRLHTCDGVNLPLWYGLATTSELFGRIAQADAGQKPDIGHGDAPRPALDFPQLPGGADAAVRPAVDVFASLDFDPDAITAPDMPDGLDFDDRRPIFLGVALDGGFWMILFGALLWWIPLLGWAGATTWALWRIWSVKGSRAVSALWTATVVLLPVLGVVAFVLFGHRGLLARRRRAILVMTAIPVLWLAVTAVAVVAGGVI